LNKGFAYKEIVDRRAEGKGLLDHLALRYGHSSSAEWRERVESGGVLLNGEPAETGTILKAGDAVVWSRPPWVEPEVPLAFAVLCEDDALVAVAKPSGLPTLPGGGFLENTLLALVRARYPGASPLHRLGRGTSGIVLFARTREAMRILSKAWRERRVLKTYRALARGRPEWDALVIDAPIGPVPHALLGRIHAATPDGKVALSRAKVLERRFDTSLVEVVIETGRPHQIRIHLAYCGHPLVGDPLYAEGGKPLGPATALPGEGGYALHAARLALPHPLTGAPFKVECTPPKILREGWEAAP
jgi:23S rRNA pseudouridine1911/1915/1917 synthase